MKCFLLRSANVLATWSTTVIFCLQLRVTISLQKATGTSAATASETEIARAMATANETHMAREMLMATATAMVFAMAMVFATVMVNARGNCD